MKKYPLCILLLSIPLGLGAASLTDLERRVTSTTLPNGLRILIYERHEIPTFTGALGVLAGGVDDPKGGTGLAHLFEHMSFKGTPVIGSRNYAKELELMKEQDAVIRELQEAQKKTGVDPTKVEDDRKKLKELEEKQQPYIVKDEIDRIYDMAGANGTNAGTSNDTTVFYTSLPSNKLELWFLMESERYKHTVLREFYTERDVVREERREYDDTPDGKLEEEFYSAAFRAHPYHEPVVGWIEDLDQLTRETAENYYRTYYVPANTVITIVGDVDPKAVLTFADKYFGDAPSAPRPPAITTREPAQRGERLIQVEWEAEPQFVMGFHKPTYPNRDAFVMDVISNVLATGRSSRLWERLVKKEQKVSDVSSGSGPGRRFDNLMIFAATPVAPATCHDVIAEIREELDRLAREPVTPTELEKALNQVKASQVRGIGSNRFAFSLLINELMYNDWRMYLKRADIVASITPQEIMDAARKYLIDENCTVAEIVRKPAPAQEVKNEK